VQAWDGVQASGMCPGSGAGAWCDADDGAASETQALVRAGTRKGGHGMQCVRAREVHLDASSVRLDASYSDVILKKTNFTS